MTNYFITFLYITVKRFADALAKRLVYIIIAAYYQYSLIS